MGFVGGNARFAHGHYPDKAKLVSFASRGTG